MANWKAWFAAQEEKKKQEELAKKPIDDGIINNEKSKEESIGTVSETLNNEEEYFKFHKNKNVVNKHSFLSEELFVPRVQNCDTQRLEVAIY